MGFPSARELLEQPTRLPDPTNMRLLVWPGPQTNTVLPYVPLQDTCGPDRDSNPELLRAKEMFSQLNYQPILCVLRIYSQIVRSGLTYGGALPKTFQTDTAEGLHGFTPMAERKKVFCTESFLWTLLDLNQRLLIYEISVLTRLN